MGWFLGVAICVSALGNGSWGEDWPILEWEWRSLTETDWEKVTQQEKPFSLELSYLSLSTADFTRIAKNRNVVKLVLWGCDGVNDQIGSFLEKMPQLQSLSIYDGKWTDEGIACLRDCSDLTVISLIDVPLTDRGLEALKTCRNCRMLDLSATAITGEGLAVLENMPWLTTLSLNKTAITGAKLEVLVKLPQLEDLSLQGTPLDEECFQYLEKCKGLKFLNLCDCPHIHSLHVEELKKKLPRTKIWY